MRIALPSRTGPASGLSSTGAEPKAVEESAFEVAAPADNEPSSPDWYIPPQVIQGKDVITPPAGFRDRFMAEAERFAFDAIQATAARDSLSFWDNPEEDVYEDL